MSLRSISICVFLVLVSLASAQVYFEKGSPHVKLANSAVISGKVDFSRDGRPFNSFVGIPFGKVAQRFAEAQLISEPVWEGIYSAVKPGPMCAQSFFKPGEKLKMESIGEDDCLNLNVYVSMNNTQRKGGLAVLVWVHGGGFVIGGGFGYGPQYFMDEDVILVTINYRLGVFGYLSTADEVVPGNNGLKDQVLALRWVQENIKDFGGDPEKVTIFGESAGGASTHFHLISPLSQGLFQRAISQSGDVLSVWSHFPDPKADAVKLATHLKCETAAANPSEISSAEIVTCLRKLSVEELNDAQTAFAQRWPFHSLPLTFGPVQEPASSPTPFLTKSPWVALLESPSSLSEVPWMIGTTEDEGASLYAGQIMQVESLRNELNSEWARVIPRALLFDKFLRPEDRQVVVDKIREFYFGGNPVSTDNRANLTNLYSDAYFSHSIRKSVVETVTRRKKGPVYLYQYAHKGPATMLNLFGVPVAEEEKKKSAHADDCILLFNLDAVFPAAKDVIKADSIHEEFSKNLVKLWVSFSIHGKPKHFWGNTNKNDWKPISKNDATGKSPLKWFRLSSDPALISDTLGERTAFWEDLINTYMRDALQPSASSQGKKTEL